VAASMREPLVENFTPTPRSMAYSTISKKSRRMVGSPPPMFT
jgi:hypothetical protein